MKSNEGKASVISASGDFNWGDVMMDITDEFLIPHGLRRCDDDIETIVLDQDEILFPKIQDEILNIEN